MRHFVVIELPFMCEENMEKAQADIREGLSKEGRIPGWQWSHRAEVFFRAEDEGCCSPCDEGYANAIRTASR